MVVLRKACRNCTVSKRKCVVELPRCKRCAEKGLACTYDLEPLSAPTTKAEKLPDISFNPSTCAEPGYCIMKTLQYRAGMDMDPAICSPGHQDAFELIHTCYHPGPDLIRARKPGTFIHPKLHLHSTYNHLAIFEEAGSAAVSSENLKRLLQIDFKKAPIPEALTALQALILQLATVWFPSSQVDPTDVDQYYKLLTEWNQTLVANLQAGPPRSPSPWQDWLFGESVRRTILMSYALLVGIASFQYGYCDNWLLLESLPFDRRPGLWMAESPQAWIAAAGAKTGDEVGECLSSFHEFAEYHRELGRGRNFRGDPFLTMVALIHNGA